MTTQPNSLNFVAMPLHASSNELTVRAMSSAANQGLQGSYYVGRNFNQLQATRVDASVDFDWAQGSPTSTIGQDDFSVRWTGTIQPQYSETYTFYTNADDGVRLWVNGQLLIDNWTDHAVTENSGAITLAAAQSYDIKLEYYERSGDAICQLLWSSDSQIKEIIPSTYLSPTGSDVFATVTDTAKRAATFVDSIGFNTHLHYYDTAYGDFSLIKQRLQEAGIQHIRDGGSDPTWVQRINQLGSEGIKTTVVIDPNIGVGPDASYDIKPPGYQVLNFVKNIIPQGTEAVEILNEFDLWYQSGYSRNGQPVTSDNWVAYLRDFTRDTYNQINSDPATQDIAVIGPSFVYGDSSQAMGDLSQWVDYGNMHPYNYPSYPGNGNLNQEMSTRSLPFRNLPMIATEAGYHTADTTNDRAVSEAVQGKYIPRVFLNNFNQGIYRTFSYELIDQKPIPHDGEANFGILRYDGSPKPAFTAVKNLIQLLDDTETNFTPGTLNYRLSGNTNYLQQTLLQKQNGDFYLVLWLEVPSTDQVTSHQVTLTLNTAIEQATTYLPNESADAMAQVTSPTQLTLTVPDSPLVVKLTPRSTS
ncbi:PA14 domain-containing protein [Pantanalinema rosaneae CENA516]|uniref:PA14 domain-containing protein n=1 Tax=Pantanalinema rosaneae TaxID=1620701 RepID=UPI003D6F9A46